MERKLSQDEVLDEIASRRCNRCADLLKRAEKAEVELEQVKRNLEVAADIKVTAIAELGDAFIRAEKAEKMLDIAIERIDCGFCPLDNHSCPVWGLRGSNDDDICIRSIKAELERRLENDTLKSMDDYNKRNGLSDADIADDINRMT